MDNLEKKRVVITKLKKELFLDTKSDVNHEMMVILVYENERLTDISCYPVEETSLLGNIYIGKVQNIVKNLNAAFIQFSEQEKGYYSLENFKTPVFTKKIGKKPLCIGDELLVQVEREAIKTKDPYLTTNLNLSG